MTRCVRDVKNEFILSSRPTILFIKFIKFYSIIFSILYAVIFKFQCKVFVGDFVEGFTEIEDDDISCLIVCADLGFAIVRVRKW